MTQITTFTTIIYYYYCYYYYYYYYSCYSSNDRYAKQYSATPFDSRHFCESQATLNVSRLRFGGTNVVLARISKEESHGW